MKRKPLVVLFALVLLAGSLFGCAGADEPASGKIRLEFWTLQLADFRAVLQPMIDRYEQAHPNIEIAWVDVPFSEGEKRALTAMLSPHVPDVINLNPDFSAVLASRNALLDIAPYIAPDQRNAYLGVAWQACSLRGKPFGIPWYLTSKVTLYHQPLVGQAGFEGPPTTYQALPDFARAVRQRTAGYALMPSPAEGGNFLKELQQRGIRVFDDNLRAVFADSPRAVAHLAQWVRLYQQGWIPPESLTEGHRAAVDRYQAGSLALLLSGPNFLNIVRQNAPSVFQATQVAPQFPADTQAVDFSTMLLVIPKNTRHPRQAVDFALYMTNAANQLALSKAAPVLPSVRQALADPELRAAGHADLTSRARRISIDQLLRAKRAFAVHPRQHDINEIMAHSVQQALRGDLPPAMALQQAQIQINGL